MIIFVNVVIFYYICIMKKLFIYFVIRLTTRHALTALKIYQTIYEGKEKPKSKKTVLNKVEKKKVIKEEQPKFSVDPKKQEILDSLHYLKSKEIKTKQDKSSISMLEGVLASM